MFCLFFLFPVIFISVAASCKPGEYEINGICCPMCNAGSVVKIHCTPTSPSIVCVPCVDGTYIDHPNGLTKCLKCTECDTGAGMREVKKCNYNSNTECDCKPGYYCPSNERPCDLCSPHTICHPGQYVKEQGTSTSNNVCGICPDESFSTSNMSKTCTPWTKCSEKGGVQTQLGTKTTDRVCVDRRNHYTLMGAIGFVLFSASSFWIFRNYILENISSGKECKNSEIPPVQETRPING